jgi:recombination protein RecA
MPTAQHLRAQIEATLAQRIPSALTPLARVAHPVAPTGISEIDLLLSGGFPVGAISEIVGPECSGRTSLALKFVAGLTQAGKICAWVDVSDALHPESAAASGVDLSRLLWVRCGLAQDQAFNPSSLAAAGAKTSPGSKPRTRSKSWSRLEQALRATDLLLQAGGFSCIVLDMGSLHAEYALRVPLATWFRFRAAAERWQSNVLLLTQHPCSRNSAGLVLRLEPGRVLTRGSTIFTGLEHRAELERQRFPQSPGNIYSLRKPPQSVQTTGWQSSAVWAGRK